MQLTSKQRTLVANALYGHASSIRDGIKAAEADITERIEEAGEISKALKEELLAAAGAFPASLKKELLADADEAERLAELFENE